MYSKLPNFVLGFHGCDQSVFEKVLNGNDRLKFSKKNDYDWLGHGIYFWENNPKRAYEYADEQKKRSSTIKNIAVIGAIIDLGYCLNLMESNSLQAVKQGYYLMLELYKTTNAEMPENKNIGNNTDLLKRYLDCAVIESVNNFKKINNKREFDTVRGLFLEGNKLYPNAGFREKNHIQICVRNPNCIKGYFKPLEKEDEYLMP